MLQRLLRLVFPKSNAGLGSGSKILIEFRNILVSFVHEVCFQGKFSRLLDETFLGRRCAIQALNLADNLHAFQNSAKDDMTAIEVSCLYSGDEELTAVCVLACVGHRQLPSACVLEH